MASLVYVFLFALLAIGVTSRPQIDGRIAGGYEAKEGEFPYAAALYLNIVSTDEFSFCTGALISPLFVLTAAHCAIIAEQIIVVLGNPFLNATSIYEERFTVSRSNFIIPERYISGVYDWDIALLRLPQPIEPNINLQPIKLAEGNNSFAGDMATITGWGATYQGQVTIEQHLRWAANVIISNTQCVRNHSPFERILLESHVCQSTLAGRGACHGDNGAPLVVDDELVGIVAIGPGNCFREYPVVFTRITSFRSWIRENAGV